MKRPYVPAWLGAALVAGALLPGCASGGDDDEDGGDMGGTPPLASISGVIPGEAFVGREAEVVVQGSNTAWSEGVQADFGPGITVNSVSVASPTALLVSITADPGAPLGNRDISVGDLTFASGFKLVPPIKISVQGLIAQGSISIIRAQNLDFANPFDSSSLDNNLAVAGEGSIAQVEVVEPYVLEMILLADVDAAGGPQTLEIFSGPPDKRVSYFFPGAFDMVERQPMPLSSGQPATNTVDHPFESLLYSIAPGEDLSLVTASTSSTSAEATPQFAILPASGSFVDLIDFDVETTLVTDELHYLIYWDNEGASGYEFDVSAATTPFAVAVAEGEPNDSRPLTYGDDQLTDTIVTIFRGSVELANSGDSDDFGLLDEVSTGTITQTGAYYVRVEASPFFNPDHSAYGVAVVLEDP
jgi:Quinohemoprotein amine dehydrogenase, alpha subunit domain III